MSEKKNRQWLSPAQRLAKVCDAKFEPKWLFKSEGERTVFRVAREICGETHQPDFYVMAQVSLGELFDAPKNKDAWKQINWMRCDLAICSTEGSLRLIIEVDGKGHDPANDEIKHHVYQSAGIDELRLTGK